MDENNNRIRKLMELRGVSQTELVSKTGISKASISRYVSGGRVPKQQALYKLAKALDTNEAYLMGLDVSPERPMQRKIQEEIENFTDEELKIVYDVVKFVRSKR